MIIIKSIGRKTASFSQLVNYVNKGRAGGDEFSLRHNIYSSKHFGIVKEFNSNHKILRKRSRDVNSLFHEVISIKCQDGYGKEELKGIIKELTEKYIQIRANNCLVYAVIHEQHNQIHSHLVISSNELMNTKPHYFSKHDFERIKKLIRQYAYEKYPHLEREELKQDAEKKKNKQIASTKIKDREIHLKKRTGKLLEKERVREKIKNIFTCSDSTRGFTQNLAAENFEIYTRGNTYGFIDKSTGKKYRLKTLELESEFEEMNNFFLSKYNDQENAKEQDCDKIKTTNIKSNNRLEEIKKLQKLREKALEQGIKDIEKEYSK